MKCTNKRRRVYRKKRSRRGSGIWGILFGILLVASVCVAGVTFGLFRAKDVVLKYETETYKSSASIDALLVDTFCVTSKDVSNEEVHLNGKVHAAGLFALTDGEVLYAKNVHNRLFPASTTKLLTAYVALKYGKLDDVVTVSKNAVGVPWDSSRAGLQVGDQVTLETLLYALMLPSGNDSAVAIAEYISNSEAEFAKLMNQEAALLGATNTHFVNAHGYHHKNHYTTAYDLHLIMKACATQDTLMKILSSASYRTQITQKNGTYRDVTWYQTNQYITGYQKSPSGMDVIGGKTGTTSEAGSCLVLYEFDDESKAYVSIIMGAENKLQLYSDMTELLNAAAK